MLGLVVETHVSRGERKPQMRGHVADSADGLPEESESVWFLWIAEIQAIRE